MTHAVGNYTQALYGLAKEEGLGAQILEEMNTLQLAFAQEPDFVRLLCAPNLSKEQRCAIVDKSFRGKVQPYVLNFMKLLTEKGYMRQFCDCCKAYREIYNEDNGILSVRAVSAVALSAGQAARLTDKLEKITGKTVELTNRVDPAVLGGVRLDYDGKRVDGTVKNRLDAIRDLLKNTVL